MKATLNDARIALRQWRANHLDTALENYSRGPFEDTLRDYLHTLDLLHQEQEFDNLTAAWDWALGGFVGEEVAL